VSDLSDQVRGILEFHGEGEPPSGGIVHMKSTEEALPGMWSCQNYYRQYGSKVIRRIYRKHNGCDMPETFQEAYEKFHDDCVEAAAAIGYKALADGVQMGQGNTGIVRKERFFKRLDKIFERDGFHEESKLIAITFSGDYDTTELITDYVEGASKVIAAATGLTRPNVPSSKIWDMWILALCAVGMTCYSAGYELGKRWAEADVLNGIMTATEQNVGTDE
jgi:hypothetical protein